MSDLSILCITKMGPHAEPFIQGMATLADYLGAELVLGVDGIGIKPSYQIAPRSTRVVLNSDGYIESVLDEAIGECRGGYVLRLDDDERVTPEMSAWLAARKYRYADHWAFPRMHLWPDESHYLTNPPLWPDLQTRLSVPEKAGGRPQIHQGSPFGTGRVADVAIEHHKFLVRDRAEREALLAEYERIMPGADAWAAFSVPERFESQLQARPVAC